MERVVFELCGRQVQTEAMNRPLVLTSGQVFEVESRFNRLEEPLLPNHGTLEPWTRHLNFPGLTRAGPRQKASKLAEAAQMVRHRTKPLQGVEIVQALIEQHAAT